MLALLICLVIGALPQARTGLLDRELADVIKNEFFTAFKLSEVRRRSSGEAAQVVFQPAGPFRDQVRVFVRTNGEGETRSIDAVLDRAFVDGSTSAVAREIVRVLLREGVARGDDAAIDVLVKELGAASLEKGSPAYEVFAGRQPEVTTSGRRVRVSLTNLAQGASRLLRISLQSAGAPR